MSLEVPLRITAYSPRLNIILYTVGFVRYDQFYFRVPIVFFSIALVSYAASEIDSTSRLFGSVVEPVYQGSILSRVAMFYICCGNHVYGIPGFHISVSVVCKNNYFRGYLYANDTPLMANTILKVANHGVCQIKFTDFTNQ